MAEEIKYELDDFSGGVNRKVSTFQQKKNEVYSALNATFNTIIGGVSKRLGIRKKGSDIAATTSTSTTTSTTTTSTSSSTSSSSSTTTSTSTTTTSTTTTSTSTTTTSSSTTTTSTSTSTTTSTSTSSSTSTSTTTTFVTSIQVGTVTTEAFNDVDKTISHDGGSGTNRLLVVCVHFGASTTNEVTSITYAGTNLTKAVAKAATNPPRNVKSEIWYLVAPSTGTNDVVIAISGSTNAKGATIINLTGVHQTSPLDATSAGAEGSSTTPSTDITTVNVQSMIIDCAECEDNAVTGTAGSGQTERSDFGLGTGGAVQGRGYTSTEEAQSVGAITMNWTLSSTQDWVTAAAAFRNVNV